MSPQGGVGFTPVFLQIFVIALNLEEYHLLGYIAV
jgi:hypothetical protein